MAPIVGVDVSHWNPPAQLAKAIADGAKFVIVKANTASSLTPDPLHAAHVAAARHAGLHVGHYHFATDVTEALSEADTFLVTANPTRGDALVLDLEATNGTPQERVAYACVWLERVAAHTDAHPILYVNRSWLSSLLVAATPAQRHVLQSFPLWIATAGAVAGTPGVGGWTLHQYSTAGGIDHDLLAPGAKWSDFAIPLAAPKPTPPPAPKEDDLDMATKLIVTAYDTPGTPPDALVLVDLEARTYAWLPEGTDAAAAEKAGAVVAPLSAAFVGGLTLAGPAPHA